jgi:hypothetical protein
MMEVPHAFDAILFVDTTNAALYGPVFASNVT